MILLEVYIKRCLKEKAFSSYITECLSEVFVSEEDASKKKKEKKSKGNRNIVNIVN